jgi:hypothetical protein
MSAEIFNIRKSILIEKLKINKITDQFLKKLLDDFKCPITQVKLGKSEKNELLRSLEGDIKYLLRKQDDTIKLKRGISLIDPSKHLDWEIDKSNRYYWNRLENYLKKELTYKLNDPQKAADLISSLDTETEEILSKMENPKRIDFDWKGLVIGYVQSGKTANFTALSAKAADAGYNLIIIFAGLWDSLRQQTQIRMDRELTGINDLGLTNLVFIDPPNDITKKWKRLTRAGYLDSEEGGEFKITNIESPDELFGQNFPPLLVIMKKNPAVISRFRKWLKGANKSKNIISALLIDDEADQASIDTNNKAKQIKESAATNKLIRELLSDFERKAYLGYTATPFANVLISHSKKSKDGLADLYPRNLIHFLPKSENYFGTAEMFGDVNYKLFVKETKDLPKGVIRLATNKELSQDLEKAIHFFILSSAVRIYRGQAKKAMSMLIHVSHKIADMKTMYIAVDAYFTVLKSTINIKKNKDKILKNLKELYESGNDSLKEKMLCVNKKFNFTNKIPQFNDIEKSIVELINSIEIRQLNSLSEDKLDYARNSDIKVIAIGGNQLSRGLTLEGLSTSFYLRDTRQNDTLLQMARWFGYRTGYEDVVTLFTSTIIRENFQYLAEVETKLSEELEIYKEDRIKPCDYAPRILDHARMNVTSGNKMGAGGIVDISYSDSIVDVTWVALDNKKILENNLTVAENLIKNIPSKFKAFKGSYVAHDISSNLITQFLRDYQHPIKIGQTKPDIRMTELLTYINKKNTEKELEKWDIIIVGNQNPIGRNSQINWLNFNNFNMVTRTRREKNGSVNNGNYNLGSVSTNADRTMLQKNKTEKITTPKILIYRINKDSEPLTPSNTRKALFEGINYPVDVLAFSIVFPATNNKNDRRNYIQQIIEK